MGTVNKPHIELDGKRLLRVRDCTIEAGRTKTKIVPSGSDVAKDTSLGAKTAKGTLVIFGTQEDGYEFDWVKYCNDGSKHTLVKHYNSAERRLITGVEFSTNSDKTDNSDTSGDVTLNWEGDGEAGWE